MADYDRGAYTPQTDAPLAFDPRRPSERRPMPMALIGSAVVLVVLLAGVAMVYRSGVRHAGEAPRPVGEPVMSVKTAAPEAPAASSTPANLDVYNATGAAAGATTNATGSAPVFAAPAEQPAARPQPKPQTLAMLAKPQAAPVRRPTPAQSAVAKAAEDAQVKPEPDAAPASVASHPSKLAKADALDASEVAAAGMTRASAARAANDDEAEAQPTLRKPVQSTRTATAPTASGATTASVVQIGAFSSDSLAAKGYADVASAMAGQMGGKSRHVEPLERDGKTLYRTWVGGFASRTDAKAFCEALKAKGKICIVKG